jgi:hypothetical protein
MGYFVAPSPPTELTPNNLDGEERWAMYFSRIIDVCQSQEESDYVYQYWADCINSRNYRPIPPPPQTIDQGSIYHSIIKRASSVPAPPPATPKPRPSDLGKSWII